MTPDQIALIRSHAARLKGIEDDFAAAFYARLFQIAPQLRRMFPADLAEQRMKLMTAVVFAVNALDRPEALAPALHSLGARHAAYGVTVAHFAPVAEALTDTLAVALGTGFDAQAQQAWAAALGALAGLMAEGMNAAALAAVGSAAQGRAAQASHGGS